MSHAQRVCFSLKHWNECDAVWQKLSQLVTSAKNGNVSSSDILPLVNKYQCLISQHKRNAEDEEDAQLDYNIGEHTFHTLMNEIDEDTNLDSGHTSKDASKTNEIDDKTTQFISKPV